MQWSRDASSFYLMSDKVKFSLYVIKHHFVRGYGRLEGLLHVFLTLVLDRGKWSASHIGCFTPGEIAVSGCWIRVWVGPVDGVNTLKKTILCPLQTDDTVLTELSWILQNRSGKFKKLSLCVDWHLVFTFISPTWPGIWFWCAVQWSLLAVAVPQFLAWSMFCL